RRPGGSTVATRLSDRYRLGRHRVEGRAIRCRPGRPTDSPPVRSGLRATDTPCTRNERGARRGDAAMTLPVTVDFHAHAQSPKAMELIASAPANPGGEANPHNAQLARTRYDAAFRDIHVRL